MDPVITIKAAPRDTQWHALAPAKLNLFLHVIGQREDGYHNLQTVFQLLDWGDTLHFTRRNDGKIIRTANLDGIPETNDLSVRAAQLLQAHTGCSYGVEIGIDKHIPIGAGLGGGSSDAATTLLVLNQLWDLDLPRTTLQQLGLALGADVPFFIFGQNAFAEGIGEKLQALTLPTQYWLIVTPPVFVSTADIFSTKELTRETKNIKIADFLASWNPYTVVLHNTALQHGLRNDLQPIAVQRYAEVAAVLDWFRTTIPSNPARMTGSGSSVFAAFPNQASALAAQKKVPAIWFSQVAKSVQQHPLWYYSS